MKKALGLIAVVGVLIAVILVWRQMNAPQNPLVPEGNGATTALSISDFDQFQRDLAARVLAQLTGNSGGNDFSVIVATFGYPLGTLLNATSSIPASLDDCAPSSAPQPFGAPRLFPAYKMSSNTALEANIGSRALQGLVSAGVNLAQAQSVEYNIADTQIQIMDDKSVQQVMSQGSCGSYITKNPGVRLIRGVVIGKMAFTVQVDNPASVKAQLANIGGFSINDNPQSATLSIADQQTQPIVQLLSEFRPDPNNVAMKAKPQAIRETATLPAPATGPNKATAKAIVRPHMFVQMDELDKRASGDRVVRLLREKWPGANVESKVEQISTRRMPSIPQVRYFNESDADLANRCVAILSALYPNMRAVRVGLPSPAGQIEVWLPKVRAEASISFQRPNV